MRKIFTYTTMTAAAKKQLKIWILPEKYNDIYEREEKVKTK